MRLLSKIKLSLMVITVFSFSLIYIHTETTLAGIQEVNPCNPPELSTLNETQSAWIILAGDTIEENDDVEAMRYGSNKTYEILRGKGFPAEKIYFLGPEVYPITQPYMNDSATRINLQWAIEEWAPLHVGSEGSLGLYFLSHGGVDGDSGALAVLVGEALWDYQLSSYLNNFESTTGCKRIIVVIEGCHSGAFINNLSKENRIIITSTSQVKGAAFNAPRNWGAFSEAFWSSIIACKTIGESFDDAVDHIRDLGCNQSPQLDDNHDGTGTTPYPNDDLPTGGEGYDALDTKIQYYYMPCYRKIQIKYVPLPIFETYDPFTCSAVIEVEVENPALIDTVYARFVPVGWEANDPLDGYMYPINDDETQMIELESPTMDENFMGDIAFDGIALGDSYKVNIIVYDTNGYVSDIVSTYLTFNADGTAPLDTTNPSVFIVNPDSGDVVKDTIKIKVTGDDDQMLENIDL